MTTVDNQYSIKLQFIHKFWNKRKIIKVFFFNEKNNTLKFQILNNIYCSIFGKFFKDLFLTFAKKFPDKKFVDSNPNETSKLYPKNFMDEYELYLNNIMEKNVFFLSYIIYNLE